MRYSYPKQRQFKIGAFHPPNSLTPRCWATEEIKPAQDLRSELDLSRVDDSLLTRDSKKCVKDPLGYRETQYE